MQQERIDRFNAIIEKLNDAYADLEKLQREAFEARDSFDEAVNPDEYAKMDSIADDIESALKLIDEGADFLEDIVNEDEDDDLDTDLDDDDNEDCAYVGGCDCPDCTGVDDDTTF